MPRSRLALVAITIGVAVSGCRIGTLSPDEFDREYPVGRLTTLAPPGSDESLEALREAVGGRPVRITMLTFFDDFTQITAQNPRVPSNFDTYTYWQGNVSTSAVSMHGDQEQRLKQELFDLDIVPFDRLPELARKSHKDLPIDGARVSRVNVSIRNSRETTAAEAISAEGLEIEMTIDSERRDGRVVYDGRGNLLTAKQD